MYDVKSSYLQIDRICIHDGQKYIQIEIQKDRKIERQIDRKIDRQKYRYI